MQKSGKFRSVMVEQMSFIMDDVQTRDSTLRLDAENLKATELEPFRSQHLPFVMHRRMTEFTMSFKVTVFLCNADISDTLKFCHFFPRYLRFMSLTSSAVAQFTYRPAKRHIYTYIYTYCAIISNE